MVQEVKGATPYQRGAGEVVHIQGVDLQLQIDAVCVLRAVRDSAGNYYTSTQC